MTVEAIIHTDKNSNCKNKRNEEIKTNRSMKREQIKEAQKIQRQ
jgi:hypothetical protein